ncbi:S-adenosylmethionine:tRNA ribosyltransferase-isomerase [Streptomyces sp. NPDC048566]|uniref:S-adenosylmethionine:tRNA ribosyltransferase-isomerase n=1 Tax=Streptomyces sp. NPDC048566 TaxID=3365569 RepID=UPI0037135477
MPSEPDESHDSRPAGHSRRQRQPHSWRDFSLPRDRQANAPPEERGSGRDDVRLLVGRRVPHKVSHHSFWELPRLLQPLDVLVVNTSATAAAAIDGSIGREPVVVQFSTQQDDGRWVVELRTPHPGRSGPTAARAGSADAVVELVGGVRVVLEEPLEEGSQRLWLARIPETDILNMQLRRHGRPIEHGELPHALPLSAHQTVFAQGAELSWGPPVHQSAEMPSAARPFTDRMVTALVTKGVVIAPIELHARLAPVAAQHPPRPERFRIPPSTAVLINTAREHGGRVVAVGTTAVRAVESAAHPDGRVQALQGWTDLVVMPERSMRTVSGLLTGLHEPLASHLHLLEAVAGPELLASCYAEALDADYVWGAFGDVNLLMPE